MVFALILALVIAVVMIFFALENPTMVTISFFGYAVEGSLALFILAAVGVGILIGVLVMTPGRVKSGLTNARHRKRIGTLETSLEEHKTRLSEMEKQREPAPKELEKKEDE